MWEKTHWPGHARTSPPLASRLGGTLGGAMVYRTPQCHSPRVEFHLLRRASELTACSCDNPPDLLRIPSAIRPAGQRLAPARPPPPRPACGLLRTNRLSSKPANTLLHRKRAIERSNPGQLAQLPRLTSHWNALRTSHPRARTAVARLPHARPATLGPAINHRPAQCRSKHRPRPVQRPPASGAGRRGLRPLCDSLEKSSLVRSPGAAYERR